MNANLAKIVVAILGIAFLLRAAWGLAIPVIPLSDSAAYAAFARTLADFGVYGWTHDQPTAYWPVGTSAIYAILFAIFGSGFSSIVLLNIALGTGIVGLTIWLARTFFDQDTAILAGSLMAIWPSQIAFTTVLASELPFTFFVLLGFCAYFSLRRSKTARGIVAGISLGVATYIRPIAILLPLVFLLSFIFDWRKLLGQLPVVILTTVVMAVTIAPWSVRNMNLFGHFVLVSTNGGGNLWMGNNPDSDGFYMRPPVYTHGLNEYEQDKLLGETAKQYILDEPVAFVVRTIKKAALLHAGETIAVGWNTEGIKQQLSEKAVFPLKLLTQVFWTVVLFLSVIGLIVLARQRGIISTITHPIVATWMYFTAVYAVTVVQDRYHFPSHPLIAMLAAVAILAFSKHVKRRTAVKAA